MEVQNHLHEFVSVFRDRRLFCLLSMTKQNKRLACENFHCVDYSIVCAVMAVVMMMIMMFSSEALMSVKERGYNVMIL